MDRLTLLENEIGSILLGIDGTIQSSGYTYYTVTGQVEIEDDCLATDSNLIKADVNHVLTGNDSEEINEEWGLGQNIYTNSVTYTLTSQIKLTGGETNTKRSAKIKCNELLSDIKYAFGTQNGHSLNQKCNWVKYATSRPFYDTTGNKINSAKLITTIELNYSQALNNPDILAC